jgi:hypothetical protein
MAFLDLYPREYSGDARFEIRARPHLLYPDWPLTYCLATLIEVMRVCFQRRHLDRCADIQPRSNRELVLELFA